MVKEFEKLDYFAQFIKEVLKDLNNKRSSFVFNEEQVKFIKNKYDNIKIDFVDDIYYISIDK